MPFAFFAINSCSLSPVSVCSSCMTAPCSTPLTPSVGKPFDPEAAVQPPPKKEVAPYDGPLAEPKFRRQPFQPEVYDPKKPPQKLPELSERQQRICERLYQNKPAYDGDLRELIRRHK